MPADTEFRVHFADGHKILVAAANAMAARKLAEKRHDAHITKIKKIGGGTSNAEA